MKILAVINQKGGVGKTSTTVHLAEALGLLGHKVLVIDSDPQGSAATVLEADTVVERSKDLYAAFQYGELLRFIQKSSLRNVFYIKGSEMSALITESLVQTSEFKRRLDERLSQDVLRLHPGLEMNHLILRRMIYDVMRKTRDFKYVLIDCSPSLSFLTTASCSAADAYIIPTTLDGLSLQGAEKTVEFASHVSRATMHTQQINGVLLNNLTLTERLLSDFSMTFPSSIERHLYQTKIPKSSLVSKATSHQHTCRASSFSFLSSVPKKYLQLTQEVLSRLNQL